MASAERLQNDDRMDYLNRHLAAVRDALAQDVPVKGCFVWSLL
ncbi:family 1 glycosylhydrolase [Ruegeria sp. NA]|nr:family 1 glycosylhydrolase [Ruegeria sp. NA]